MKKKLITISLLLVLIIGSSISYWNFATKKIVAVESEQASHFNVTMMQDDDYEKVINGLKEKYQNDDVIALLEIPDVLEEPIVQTKDNDYYLHYDIRKEENIIGATFLDFRNNLEESNKLLIYSHSDPEGTLPFVKLSNYNNESFYQNHKIIFLTDHKSKRKYEVFASYIETSDFDYVNLESFNGLTYEEHLNKLKNKSLIKTDVELDENSKIIILQTCSFNQNINEKTKYQLVMAKEILE